MNVFIQHLNKCIIIVGIDKYNMSTPCVNFLMFGNGICPWTKPMAVVRVGGKCNQPFVLCAVPASSSFRRAKYHTTYSNKSPSVPLPAFLILGCPGIINRCCARFEIDAFN